MFGRSLLPGARRLSSSCSNAGCGNHAPKNEYSWEMWERLEKFLSTGQVCVIDGANGTEIQRRGGKPAETFSTGTAPLARPDLCQEVHLAYLEAGCDILITNSYSANRNVMAPSGNGDRVTECILASAAISRRAAASHMSDRATQVASDAALHNQIAAQSVGSSATAAARATTSLGTNEGSVSAMQGAVEACHIAFEAAQMSLHATQEAHAAAAAANLAAKAALADSEGRAYEPATPRVRAPEPCVIDGWDAAGFGPTMIVGSLSTHPPEMPAGGASSAGAKWPSPEKEVEAYMEAARAHSVSGVDMLWLEMMKDHKHAPRAIAAAATAGVPVFLGISARTCTDSGELILFGNGSDSVPLTVDWFKRMSDLLGDCHVGVNVRRGWLGASARFVATNALACATNAAGVFEAPEWVFAELDNTDAVERVEEWVRDYNVQLLGGCCGLGPEFITAVSAFARRHNAVVRGIGSDNYWIGG